MKHTRALIAADFVKPCYQHQLVEFEAHAESPARAKAWHMRTGKSKSEIDKACHLYRQGKINGVLIFAPNGVHRNWTEREWPAHCWPGIETVCLAWFSSVLSAKAGDKVAKSRQEEWRTRREEWFLKLKAAKSDPRLMVLAVNSESMTRKDVRKAIAYFIKRRKVHVVFDESDDFGIPGSKRTKMARALAQRCVVRTILSGTLVTATPLAAFSQYELLEKSALGFTRFEDFKNHYAEYELQHTRNGRRYPALIGFKNLDDLQQRIARFTSVVLRDDCGDMPDLVPRLLKVTPTEEQLRVYRDLLRSFLVDLREGRISVGERAPRFQKLQQVFSGFLIDDAKVVHTIPGRNPRLDMLAEEVELAPGKVVIWCNFQRDIDNILRRLRKAGHHVVEYHGRVSDARKHAALTEFQTNPKVKGLVGHPKSGGRGLDMSAASDVFWYSHTFSARIRAQAMERATKIGGKNIRVSDFQAPGPDAKILSTLQSRFEVADVLAGSGLRSFLKGLEL